jgi:hypothetical protein
MKDIPTHTLETELRARRAANRREAVKRNAETVADTACILPALFSKLTDFTKELGSEVRQLGKDFRNNG